MAELPFNIPQSLRSFNERFEKNPKTGITKLSRHLKKRGPDAVGHFLLAWFYHLDDQNSLAIKEALKAKTFAPGSPLMEHLHYFLVHPEKAVLACASAVREWDANGTNFGYNPARELRDGFKIIWSGLAYAGGAAFYLFMPLASMSIPVLLWFSSLRDSCLHSGQPHDQPQLEHLVEFPILVSLDVSG